MGYSDVLCEGIEKLWSDIEEYKQSGSFSSDDADIVIGIAHLMRGLAKRDTLTNEFVPSIATYRLMAEHRWNSRACGGDYFDRWPDAMQKIALANRPADMAEWERARRPNLNGVPIV